MTGIPTEPVGSLPRPRKLQVAYHEYDAGRIKLEDLQAEQEEAVRDSIKRAEATPKDQLGSTDDCGFSPFSIDEKPNHGSPDYARDVAFQKIAARVQGTKMAAEILGVR